MADERPAAVFGVPPLRLPRAVGAERADRRLRVPVRRLLAAARGHAVRVYSLGMLARDTLAGRFVPLHWRDRLRPMLRLLLAGPYLVFLTHPGFCLACIACTAASVGYSWPLQPPESDRSAEQASLSGTATASSSASVR